MLDPWSIMFMIGQNVLWYYSPDKLQMIKTLFFSKELSVAAWHFTHTITFYVWEYARTIPILPAYLVFLLGHGQNNPPQKPQQREAQLWKLGKWGHLKLTLWSPCCRHVFFKNETRTCTLTLRGFLKPLAWKIINVKSSKLKPLSSILNFMIFMTNYLYIVVRWRYCN